jgi:CBS domain-containing protein
MPPNDRHDPTDPRTRPPHWVGQQGQPTAQQPQQEQPANQPSRQRVEGEQSRRQYGQDSRQQYGQQPQQQYGQQSQQPQQQYGRGAQRQYGQTAGQTRQTGTQSAGARSRAQQRRQPAGTGSRRSPLEPVGVSDVVTTDVVTAERDAPIRSVVAKMSENGVGSVVVVERGKPVGILTDRTIALALEERPNVAERSAGELTGGDLVTADASMSVVGVLGLMSDHNVRRIPVVDGDDLAGIVTLDDVLVHVGGVLDQIVETVRSQSPRL